MITSALILAATSLTCGLYDVNVRNDRITVNNAAYGSYQEAEIDKYFNVHYLFSDGERMTVIRETPKGRLAFRIVGESLWQSCVEGGKSKNKGGGF